MSRKISHCDWIPDLLDYRDFLRAAFATILGSRMRRYVICVTQVLPVISRQSASFSEYSPQP
jgi:hypothetical protein